MNAIVHALYKFAWKHDPFEPWGHGCTREERQQFDRLLMDGIEHEPMQPFEMVEPSDGPKKVRFRGNGIVRRLLEHTSARRRPRLGLNELAAMEFRQLDWEEFFQLLGYSLAGYHELSFVSDETALAATKAAQKAFPDEPKIAGCRDDGCQIHLGVTKAVG